MTQPRYVCIHGHFYQPPREDPWFERIEVQDSAAPHHDWNERILRECYAPNARSRMLGPGGRIKKIINNYASISFNIGPTLMSWIKHEEPHTYQCMIEADAQSRRDHAGHGNAIAQVYNHVILPLANPRDQQLQVQWGIADFVSHFNRQPEGMWLPECAVNTESLEALALNGIRFTILTPRSAAAIRDIGPNGKGIGDWREINGGIDPTQPYLCELPSGRSIALFFYDGPVSRAVAFEGILSSGQRFAERIIEGFSEQRQHPQLMHIATDGESYGHHHAHGDMALAAAIQEFKKRSVPLVNYGEYLDKHPPTVAVKIHENTAWSCEHGLGRWTHECSCRMRGDWQQRWRAPMRSALEWLRDELDQVFEREGHDLFRDPWHARLNFIRVILDRRPDSIQLFLDEHVKEHRRDQRAARALTLLEMQRHGQLMFTSCGWFFDEISGLEPTQNLKYAARAIQLARKFGRDYEPALVERLATAPSNLPEFKDGAGVWRIYVRPAMVSMKRVAAQFGVRTIYEPALPTTSTMYTYRVNVVDLERRENLQHSLAVGHVQVNNGLTLLQEDAVLAVFHFGNQDFHVAVRDYPGDAEYATLKATLLTTFEDAPLTKVIRAMDQTFVGGDFFSLADLFLEDRRRILLLSTREKLERMRGVYTRLFEETRQIMDSCRRMNVKVPRAFSVAAEYALAERALDLLDHASIVPLPKATLAKLTALCQSALAWNIQLSAEQLEPQLRATLAHHLTALRHQISPDLVLAIETLLNLGHQNHLGLDIWPLQNLFFEFLEEAEPVLMQWRLTRPTDAEVVIEGLKRIAHRLNIDPSLIDGVRG